VLDADPRRVIVLILGTLNTHRPYVVLSHQRRHNRPDKPKTYAVHLSRSDFPANLARISTACRIGKRWVTT
jgi:hypothetical protein